MTYNMHRLFYTHLPTTHKKTIREPKNRQYDRRKLKQIKGIVHFVLNEPQHQNAHNSLKAKMFNHSRCYPNIVRFVFIPVVFRPFFTSSNACLYPQKYGTSCAFIKRLISVSAKFFIVVIPKIKTCDENQVPPHL